MPRLHRHASQTPAQSIAAAERLCGDRGVRFTAMRRTVFAHLLRQALPQTAYAVLAALERQQGRKLSPPTVYRALDFLIAQQLIHKIESSSSYAVCSHPGEAHQHLYLLCDHCGDWQELEASAALARLDAAAHTTGFVPERKVVELHGRCRRCV